MHIRQVVITLLMVGSVALSACRSDPAVLEMKGDGDAKVYEIDSDAAWAVVREAFEQAGFDSLVEHRERSALVARRSVSVEASPTVAVAWIEPEAGGKTRVSFVTRRPYGSGRQPATTAELHVRLAGLVQLSAE